MFEAIYITVTESCGSEAQDNYIITNIQESIYFDYNAQFVFPLCTNINALFMVHTRYDNISVLPTERSEL